MGLFDWMKTTPERDRFAQLVMGRLRSAGILEPIEYDARLFRIVVGSGDRQAFLDNHYGDFCGAWPWRRGVVLERLVGAFLAERSDRPVDFVRVRRDLVPVIRDPYALDGPRLFAELEGRPFSRIASAPVTDDYRVALVMDSPTSMSFVTEADLARWKIPFERAMEYARDNLAASSVPPRFTEKRGVFVSAWHDNYDSSRMLFPDVVRGLPVRGRPVAAVPNRDVLVVTGDEDPDGLATLVRLVAEEIQKPRPLGAVPLVLDGGEWRTFAPRGRDRSSVLVRNLVAQARGWCYAEQKVLLEQLHEARGEPAFVATFSALKRPGAEDLVTFATWTKGLTTLLPRTSEIAFVDPDLTEEERVRGLYPWEMVEALAGDLMAPQGLAPERWLVERFPEEAVFARLAAHQRT